MANPDENIADVWAQTLSILEASPDITPRQIASFRVVPRDKFGWPDIHRDATTGSGHNDGYAEYEPRDRLEGTQGG